MRRLRKGERFHLVKQSHRFWLVGVACLGLISAAHGASPAQPQNQPVTITMITPLDDGRLKIQWEGAIPPYKLQLQTVVGAGWRDASYHIYANYYVLSNSVAGAFYRVRTIPDREPPDSLRGFGAIVLGCDQIWLRWDQNACSDPLCADNSGGTGMRGVRIYRDGEFYMEVPFPGYTVIDTNVEPSTTYSYVAAAVDKAGNQSPLSGNRTVTTMSCVSEPPPDPDPIPVNHTVTLAWDPNPESNIGGYVLSYGASSGNYTQTIDVGNVTTNTVPDLVSGATYYFVVAAYSNSGLRGDASNEVSYSAP